MTPTGMLARLATEVNGTVVRDWIDLPDGEIFCEFTGLIWYKPKTRRLPGGIPLGFVRDSIETIVDKYREVC